MTIRELAPDEYHRALMGNLSLEDPNKTTINCQINIMNKLPIAIYAAKNRDGKFIPHLPDPDQSKQVSPVDPGQEVILKDFPQNGTFGIFAFSTGGLISLHTVTDGADGSQVNFTVDEALLASPNAIGAPPVPDEKEFIIKSSSLKRVVGIGFDDKHVFVREQYWQVSSESVSLIPGQTITMSVTTENGVDRTSSTEETVSAAISAGASFGWGPISASISASLARSSNVMQQLVVRENTTRFDEIVITLGANEQPRTYIVWNLMDVVSLYEIGSGAPVSKPIAVIVTNVPPKIVSGPYCFHQQ